MNHRLIAAGIFLTSLQLNASQSYYSPCPPKPCCPPVCFERGYPDEECCIPTAYNEPASFEVGPCSWGFWIDFAFTYWTAYQDGSGLGNSFTAQTNFVTGGPSLPIGSQSVFQNTKWTPGFKGGIGYNTGYDDWGILADYTWFRSQTVTASGRPPAYTGPASGIPAGVTSPTYWIPDNWGLGAGAGLGATSFSSKWSIKMDLLDVLLTRPYYQGSALIVAPFAGLRAAWIRQKMNMQVVPSFITTPVPDLGLVPLASSYARSHSWSLGPKGGMNAKWHLGWGLRLEADASATIAFTQYTKVSASADPQSSPSNGPLFLSFKNYNALRFMNDMNLGLGWGDYFGCREYHFDFLINYDFQIFWNQNMLRAVVDEIVTGVSVYPGNLYLQGLTIKAQFDF